MAEGAIGEILGGKEILLSSIAVAMQVLQHADVAFFFGIIDTQQRIEAMTMQLLVAQLIAEGLIIITAFIPHIPGTYGSICDS